MEPNAAGREYGIETEFVDARGQVQHVSPQAIEAAQRSMAPLPAHPLIEGPAVLRSGVLSGPRLCDAAAQPVDFVVYRDAPDGLHEIARARDTHWPFSGAQFEDGVYRLKLVDARGERDEIPLIVAPRQAFSGAFGRVWVVAVQLYSLRSEANWGIGDFGDLMALMQWAAQAGAAGIGLNPLHALFDDHPTDCSPYSPSSRLFLNPLYIHIPSVPGFSVNLVSGLERRCAALRDAEVVDYAGVAELKSVALRAAFLRFMAHGARTERDEFEAFRGERGSLLARYACFEFLRWRFATPWWDWPAEWRQPDDARLGELRNGENAEAIAYFEFLQWVADRQLRGCKDLTAELGMPIGLYVDVAVGVKRDGFDAWNSQAAIARGLSVGAPPDLLNTAGQDWGLAAFSPAGLEATLFQPFRDMLAAAMRHAGAIRIDHVLGLQRLYLVPFGGSPRDGAYVRMPLEALLALVAAESQAHRCVVVGEDLGTVPAGLRERLADHGIWSYRVMLFERGDGGTFLPADRYATDALVTFNTHDLPTFAGWRSGHDLSVKRSLGLDPGETDDERARSLLRFDEVTAASGGQQGFARAVGFLTHTPCRILALALEDLLAVQDQPNIPGTIDQHPNWRRKLPLAIEHLATELDLGPYRAAMAGRGK